MDEQNLAAEAAEAEGVVAPEADTTEAEAPKVETAEAPEIEAAEPEAEEAKRPNRKSAKARIAELTRKLREAQEEAATLRKGAEKPPKYEDFNDPDEYERARVRHLVREERISEREAAAEASRKLVDETVAREWQERVTEFKAQAPDFETVAYSAPISDDVAKTIALMDEGPAVAYHLGKNPHVAAELSDMPAQVAAIELGKIAARLTAPPRKVASKAPPPVAPITAAGGPSNPDPEKMSFAEYRAWRMGEMTGKR